jgi:hypothetical protein
MGESEREALGYNRDVMTLHTLPYRFYDDSWAFVCDVSGPDLEVITSLHERLWDGSVGSDRTGELVRMGHPLADALVLYYVSRGHSLERFGLTYVGSPADELVRAAALRILAAPPIANVDAATAREIVARGSIAWEEGEFVRITALEALHAQPGDWPLIAALLPARGHEAIEAVMGERRCAIDLLTSLEEHHPGLLATAGLLARFHAMVDEELVHEVRIALVEALTDHDAGPDTTALLLREASGPPCSVAWFAARSLLAADRKRHVARAEALLARSPGNDHERSLLADALADAHGIAAMGRDEAAAVVVESQRFHARVVFDARGRPPAGVTADLQVALRAFLDATAYAEDGPDEQRLAMAVVAIDHPVARLVMLDHLAHFPRVVPVATRSALARTALADAPLGMLPARALACCGPDDAVALAIAEQHWPRNHQAATEVLADDEA